MRAGAFTASVGNSSGGRGVSVCVMAGIGVGAGVEVCRGSGVAVSAGAGWIEGSVATGSSITEGISVAAAPPQAEIVKARIRIDKTRLIIRTHLRIHAGQQAGSVSRNL